MKRWSIDLVPSTSALRLQGAAGSFCARISGHPGMYAPELDLDPAGGSPT